MPKKKKKRIATRGSVNNIILKTLVNGDKYGYEIIKEVEEFSNGKVVLKQPSLYSSLSRFEEKNIVTSYWGDSDIGGRRHYYHLTDVGHAYYRTHVLKIKDDDDVIEDEENEIVTESIDITNNTELQNDNSQETIYLETNEEIPAIINFDQKSSESVIIPDHSFVNVTPIENMIDNNLADDNQVQTKPWLELSDIVKENNRKFINTKNSKLHTIKPKKSMKMVLDFDGIYKLREEDYVPIKPNRIKTKAKIIDNVIKRKEATMYGYASYSDSKTTISNTSPKTPVELTEEEKRIRNENFVAKFNHITNAKISNNSSQEEDHDYRNKLDSLIKSDENYISSAPSPIHSSDNLVENNNLFNYFEEDEEDEFIDDIDNYSKHTEELLEEDKFIDIEPSEFEVKNDNKEYIENISNHDVSNEEIKISRYENKSKAILQDKSYILINKLKLVFGIILTIVMASELTASLFIFKHLGYYADSDKFIFIIGYSITLILALSYILPIFFNSNLHKLNNINSKISILFGILTFLISLILIYCINALYGFDLDNIKFFLIKLVVPAILAFNFVIMPPIYCALSKSRKFYD